jgi:phage virion morphogenesis protein
MITVQIDGNDVLAAMERLMRMGRDPEPALQEAGEYLIESTKRRFSTKQAPDGSPWPANAASVIEAKGRDDALIGESKRLSNEIHYRARGNVLEWGSSLEYAATQHYGAERGDFGQTENGVPIPWGDIPGREFLGLSRDDSVEVLNIMEEHARSTWNGNTR